MTHNVTSNTDYRRKSLSLLVCLFIYILQDPFGDVIKGIMNEIHIHAQLNPLCQPGTQIYEQWVVQKEQNGKRDTGSRTLRNVSFRMSETSFLNKYQ